MGDEASLIWSARETCIPRQSGQFRGTHEDDPDSPCRAPAGHPCPWRADAGPEQRRPWPCPPVSAPWWWPTNSSRSATLIAVAPNGDLYAKTRKDGIYALRDTNGDGIADEIKEFGDGGGTGIAVHNGWLYESTDKDVFRYKLAAGELVPSGKPERIVKDLPNQGQHSAKVFAFGADGKLYVESGSPSPTPMAARRTGISAPPARIPPSSSRSMVATGATIRTRLTRRRPKPTTFPPATATRPPSHSTRPTENSSSPFTVATSLNTVSPRSSIPRMTTPRIPPRSFFTN